MFKTTIAVVAVILLTALPAVLQGRFMNRWSQPPELNQAGEQLHHFPRQFGDWHSAQDERPLSEAVCRELGLVQHFHRQYVHAVTSDRLDLLLMVGPPGKLVRHPPDVCYVNRANQQIGEAISLATVSKAGEHQFELLHFQQKSQPLHQEFWVAYAFATEAGIWSSPASPRMAYGAESVLYKMQVLTEAPQEAHDQSLAEFLKKFTKEFPAALAGIRDSPVPSNEVAKLDGGSSKD